MRSSNALYTLLSFLLACAGSKGGSPQPSVPEPDRPGPTSSSPSARSWTFDYRSGTASYRITRRAEIEKQSDSVPIREIATNLTHETLTLELVEDTIRFTLVADTFATITQNLVGPTQVTGDLPIRISGLLVHDTLQLAGDSVAGQCSPVQSAIRSDVHNILVPFPSRLEPGMTWRDSVELAGCQAMVPTTTRTHRSFLVSGETVYEGIPVIIVQRSDTIQAHGDGAQQQHRVVLDATGNGTIAYYLSPSTGQIVHAIMAQELSLAIAASGKVHHFRQGLKQEFALVR
jgi:hypothetical protein